MHRRSSAFCVVALIAITTLATLVPLVSGGLPKAVASTPNSGTVSAASPTVQWHESAPLNGSAPSRRNQTCVAGGTPCDDYMLTVNRDGIPGDAKLSFTLESSSPGQVNLLFYPPGCSGDASSTDTCYQVYTDQGSKMNPANGTYLLRVACMVCAGTTYKATATLGPLGQQGAEGQAGDGLRRARHLHQQARPRDREHLRADGVDLNRQR